MHRKLISEKCKKICDLAISLKGSSEIWEFKEYVLGFVFYRYISENLANYINKIQHESGDFDFDYYNEVENSQQWEEDYRDELINEKGYFISPKNLFKNVFERFNSSPDKDNLNREMKDIFDEISGSSKNNLFSELFEKMNFGNDNLGESGKDKGMKILDLFEAVKNMEFRFKDKNGNEIDIYGIGFESLIGMYSSKIKKEVKDFYTPKEVSETLVELVSIGGREIRKVYDPACGSGSLLLKFQKNQRSEKIEFYGQEINTTTYNMCRMNMFLHNVPYHNVNIKKGDTLLDNKLDLKMRFDAVVSNPPFSASWDVKGSESKLMNDERFIKAGVLAPNKMADFAFIMHSLHYLDENVGIGAIICFPGILYRDKREKKIREYLINHNFIDAIIQIPAKLFKKNGTETCILILRKNKTDGNIFYIDASEQFEKAKELNRLNEENIRWIVNTYKERKEIEGYSRLVQKIEIEQNDYKLSVNKYLKRSNQKIQIDIEKLEREIREGAKRVNFLREEIEKLIIDLKKG